jgi:hypothetical protein
VALGGALKQKPATARPLLTVDAQRPSDPQALEILDRCLAAMAPDQVRWLQCSVWQQGKCETFNYQASGRLVTAPQERCRYDLDLKVGNTVGELRVACDGKTLRQSIRMSSVQATVTRLELPGPKDRLKSTEELAQARARFIEDNSSGPGPMVRRLRQRMLGAQCLQCRWNGRAVLVVAGALPQEQRPDTPSCESVPARFTVRQCILYLDARTLWPVRVEWWGAEQAAAPNQLVLQTEFRNPVVNQPLSAERCAMEFAVPN